MSAAAFPSMPGAAVTLTPQINTGANLRTFFSYMEQAASNHADLVVFPEIA